MEKLIMEYLKNEAKSQGISQSVLATELGVSLPTIKRWYSGKGVSIDNLKQICDFLGCSLSEVFAYVEGFSATLTTYSEAQELAFVKDPRLLAVFDYLLRKKSISFIKNKYQIKETDLHSVLYKLDKLNLIELHSNNRVKLKFTGEPAWIPNGPLSKFFRVMILDDFIGEHNKENTIFYLHDYIPEDITAIKSKIHDLENFLKLANKRALKSEQTRQSHGVYIALKKYEWDMGKFLVK